MRALVILICALLAPLAAVAQDGGTATLLADVVRVEADSRLIAEGNVQVAYEGQVLSASRVTYDRTADRLFIDGPIVLDEGRAGTVILADSAALDGDLRSGILRSARLVLDRQLQLAATQIARVGGRYVQLDNTVASSCEICADNPTPTWEIRARRVVHDRQERFIYFQRAQFRLLGVPIAYFPRLRLPDPTRSRATGVLIPRIRSNSDLGFGVKVPVFFELGDHADLTLTPYLSRRTTTLEGRYRQTFARAAVHFEGAVSRDDVRPDTDRFYLFGSAVARVRGGLRLEFDLETVSDEDYLAEYGYPERDRLRSEMRLAYVDRDTLFRIGVAQYETLRAAELPIEDELPSTVTELVTERRMDAPGGELRFGADAITIYRRSDEDGAGRDVAEFGLKGAYLTRAVFGPGLVWQGRADLAAGVYRTRDDSSFSGSVGRIAGNLSGTLRLPMQRTDPAGTRQLIEPVVQVAWSDASSEEVPNEDSLLVEFDEGNLFAVSRFPGDDATETGLRTSLGMTYTARFIGGQGVGLTLGRIERAEPEPAFPVGSGLETRSSSWLAAARLSLGDRLDVTARSAFTGLFDSRQTEARISWRDDSFSLETSYLWKEGQLSENRPTDTHELLLDGRVRVARHWIGTFEGRYDFNQDRAAAGGIGVIYRTECIEATLGVDRRFATTPTIDPVTSFNFGVSLIGFGAGRVDETYRKRCNG